MSVLTYDHAQYEIEPAHRHWWHGFTCHFGLGPEKDQTIHYHPCQGDADVIDGALENGTERDLPEFDCGWALLGTGYHCDGQRAHHWRQSLWNRVLADVAQQEAMSHDAAA